MIDPFLIKFIITLNFLIYIGFTLPLDLKTYLKRNPNLKQKISPESKINFWSILAFITSGCVWIVFFLNSIAFFLNLQISYIPKLIPNTILFNIFQLLGAILISCGTIIAVLGRYSRWDRAFSWGIPTKLETKGMYRWIRHPLYSSYIFYFLGFPLLYLNPFFLFLLLGIIGYFSITLYEEALLVKYFPEEYPIYQKKVKRFIPLLW
ncbi:methyltransferase family protein [Candidatus Hodarchaeum mangrovi]